MQYALTLIDKASKVCKSDAELARRLGVSRAAVSMMRSGKLKISPEMAAFMADIAGENARDAYIAAGIENARGTKYEGALREVLGKALAAGVAGVLAFSYSDGSTSIIDQSKVIAKNHLTINDSIHRIYCIVRSWFRRMFMRCMGDCTDVHRALAFG